MREAITTLSELGGFTGIAAIIATIPALRRIQRDSRTAAEEAKPNHGGSMRDAITRIETTVKLIKEIQYSQSKEIERIQHDNAVINKSFIEQLDEHTHRIIRLEGRSKEVQQHA